MVSSHCSQSDIVNRDMEIQNNKKNNCYLVNVTVL